MKDLQEYHVFIGYDIPQALDIKHSIVIPLLDTLYEQIEIEGDILHKVKSIDEIHHIGEIIELFNEYFDFNLTVDFNS